MQRCTGHKPHSPSTTELFSRSKRREETIRHQDRSRLVPPPQWLASSELRILLVLHALHALLALTQSCLSFWSTTADTVYYCLLAIIIPLSHSFPACRRLLPPSLLHPHASSGRPRITAGQRHHHHQHTVIDNNCCQCFESSFALKRPGHRLPRAAPSVQLVLRPFNVFVLCDRLQQQDPFPTQLVQSLSTLDTQASFFLSLSVFRLHLRSFIAVSRPPNTTGIVSPHTSQHSHSFAHNHLFCLRLQPSISTPSASTSLDKENNGPSNLLPFDALWIRHTRSTSTLLLSLVCPLSRHQGFTP